MSCKEAIRGLILPSAAISGVGTAVDLSTLSVDVIEYNEITVTNDADRPIKVGWTNSSTGLSDYFFVPEGGKSFTHRLGRGAIAPTSLKVYSNDAGTLATGNITINVASN